MSVLQKCVENQARVKVLTRKLNGVRGTCTGVLVAFDKHWNLGFIHTYFWPKNSFLDCLDVLKLFSVVLLVEIAESTLHSF